jgi:hypothetical protein
MAFPHASTAFAATLLALALGSACTGTRQTCETGGACSCDDGCGQSYDAGALEDAGCPSGTVLVIDTGQPSQATGCYANVSCGTPLQSAFFPASWSAAQQTCASSEGVQSLITTTPCDGFGAFVFGIFNSDGGLVVRSGSQIYDVTTGAPVAVLSPGPGGSYACNEGEVSIPAACMAALTVPGTPCTSFDAGLTDAGSD